MEQQLAVSVREAGRLLDLGRTTVYGLIRENRIRAVRFSERGRLRIPRSEVERLVRDGIDEPRPETAQRATARNGGSR